MFRQLRGLGTCLYIGMIARIKEQRRVRQQTTEGVLDHV